MKKLFTLVLCIAAILVIGTVVASAEATEEAGFWVENATNIEEILAGEAGEREIAWEVPFMHIKPTLDGTIEKNEYYPFELYENYMSWMANSDDDATGTVYNTIEEFNMFYEAAQEGFFEPYWGWDGEYLYMAFKVNCINGFKCTPEVLGGDVYLFAYNCLQVGIADVDATGRHDSYVELGFGVHSETNDPITFNWAGNYLPKAGDDFVGYYDAENQVLYYELRIHLQSALGLTDRTVANGDEMNFAWLLSVNGETTSASDTWQLAFCHGIGGPYSGKENKYFARVTFNGMPDGTDIPVANIPGMSEEDKTYKLMEFIDMSDESVVKTFEGENAAVEYITEGEESFMRITSLSNTDYPYAYSTKYPKNILGGQGDFIVVKYRTSSAECEDLGVVFRNVYDDEHHPDDCYTEVLGMDGEWHVVIYYMNGEPNWQHFIVNIGLVPFAYSEASAQETIDIAWIKFYQNDPTDIYLDQIYEEEEVTDEPATEDGEVTAQETEPAGEEATTVADGDATKAPEATGGAATDPVAGDDEGCGSVIGLSSLAVLMAAAAAAVVLKKKED